MGLANYTELQAAIATRLHRSDLTTQIVDYVTIAEKRINRLLMTTDSETEATLTATIGSRAMTPPSGFGSPIALYCTTYLPRLELPFRLPEEITVLSDNGAASYWTVDGAEIKTDAPADIAYTYTLRYSAAFDIAVSSTNTVLTKYPELYLYGALVEAGLDLGDTGLVSNSTGRFDMAMREALDDVNKVRRLANLTTELCNRSDSNIFNG